jgi:hypothetical protein
MNTDTRKFCQPRWKPIGQYRTRPLDILPILPLMKRIIYPLICKNTSIKILLLPAINII